MSIVRIEGGPLAGYNGELVGVIFEDGVSTTELSPQMVNRLSAVVNIVNVETGLQAGIAADLIRFKDVSLEVKEPEVEQESVEFTEVGEEVVAEVVSEAKYSQEQLEAVADKSGIAGVREIGDQFGVKGTSISGIITGIIEAQKQG